MLRWILGHRKSVIGKRNICISIEHLFSPNSLNKKITDQNYYEILKCSKMKNAGLRNNYSQASKSVSVQCSLFNQYQPKLVVF